MPQRSALPSSARSQVPMSPRGTSPTAVSTGTLASSSGAPSTIMDALRAHQPEMYDGLARIADAWETPERDDVLAPRV